MNYVTNKIRSQRIRPSASKVERITSGGGAIEVVHGGQPGMRIVFNAPTGGEFEDSFPLWDGSILQRDFEDAYIVMPATIPNSSLDLIVKIYPKGYRFPAGNPRTTPVVPLSAGTQSVANGAAGLIATLPKMSEGSLAFVDESAGMYLCGGVSAVTTSTSSTGALFALDPTAAVAACMRTFSFVASLTAAGASGAETFMSPGGGQQVINPYPQFGGLLWVNNATGGAVTYRHVLWAQHG